MSDLIWGLQMTMLGMGLVFGLLGLLWGLLTLVLRFDKAPEPAAAASRPAAEPTASATAPPTPWSTSS
ncbi:MAG TPA: OadG family transporter subunit, partial [Rubrivivax sp.]|nr:OadG family transporter subunit [Rubrivivax sp.]